MVDSTQSIAVGATSIRSQEVPEGDSSQEIAERVSKTLCRAEDECKEAAQLPAEIERSQSDDTNTQKDWPVGFKLSIVIPVYNEQATIETVLNRVLQLNVPKEIVVVDDCSTDETQQILERFEQDHKVQVITFPVNQGKGAALRTGFAQASGDIVVIQDADLEYDPADIPGLLTPILADEADIVYGSRFLGDRIRDRSVVHRLGNRLLTWASNRTTGLSLTDMETCYKAFRLDAIRGIRLEQDRFGFEPEVTAKLARRGFRFHEVPIDYSPRGYRDGKKIGVKDLVNALYCIWRYGHME